MKNCRFEKKYDKELNRCLRDGSLRHCKYFHCVYFKPTLFYRLIEKLKEVF